MNTKKCIVVDLDNTLWGGVVGEDGFDGIKLSLAEPGASFVAFQQGLRDLYDRGVVLAINSRNTEDDALSVICRHPNMILKENHFAARRINWDDKVENMRSLAQELRLGLDSMVFLDDDPVNRAAMRAFLSEVETPELPADPAKYLPFLLSLPYFPTAAITDEDKMRGNLYVTERLRMENEKTFADREAFLHGLGLWMAFHEDENALERLAQLTEKTNQFNIRKHPLTTDELSRYARSETHRFFYARLADRFGDYGIIAFALVQTDKERWHIESLLMSCRVLARGVEDAFLAAIARRAREAGAHELTIGFVASEKNKPAADFVGRAFPHSPLLVGEINEAPYVTVVFA